MNRKVFLDLVVVIDEEWMESFTSIAKSTSLPKASSIALKHALWPSLVS